MYNIYILPVCIIYIDSTDIISLSAQIKQMKIIKHEIWIKACR